MSKLRTKHINSCWVCHNKIDAHSSSYLSLSWFDHSANNLELRLHTCRDVSELFIVLYEVGYPGRAPTPACIALNTCRVTWPDLFRVMTTVEMVLYMDVCTYMLNSLGEVQGAGHGTNTQCFGLKKGRCTMQRTYTYLFQHI